MGLLDGILGQLGGAAGGIEALAEKVGIPKEMAEQAVAALGQSHAEPGDTDVEPAPAWGQRQLLAASAREDACWRCSVEPVHW